MTWRNNQIFSRGYYKLDDIIGIELDQSNSSPTLKRIDEDGENLSADYNWSKYFSQHPVFGQIRRCKLTDAGVATFGSDGKGTGIDLTTDYVMTRFPGWFFKYKLVDSTKHRWWLSPEASAGFTRHYAFNQRGHSSTPAEQVYVGSFMAGANGGTTADNGSYNTIYATDWTGLKLTSKSGSKALSGSGSSGTMAQFEAAGNAIGTGWGIENFWTYCMRQLLFYIRYASLNSQTALGNGRTNASNVCASIPGTYLDQTTAGAGVDIQSLLASDGSYGDLVGSYRPCVYPGGVESLIGLWEFKPGYNTTDTAHRVLNRDGTGTIASVLASGSYEEVTDPVPLNGVTNISGTDAGTYCHGYISDLAMDSAGILNMALVPGAFNGGSNVEFCDYGYSHQYGIGQTGVLLVGGYWNYGTQAGVGCRRATNESAYVYPSVGARAEFIG